MANLKTLVFGDENRIGRRLIVLVVAFSSLITLVISVVQLAYEYRELRSGLDRQLDEVGIYVPSIAGSVWDFDEKQLRLALDALVRLPNIDRASVSTPDSRQQWMAGNALSSSIVTRTYSLSHQARGRETAIGTLEVVASLDAIYRQVAAKALTIVLGNGLKTFLVALFMVYILRRLVTNRLELLSFKVNELIPRMLPLSQTVETGPQSVPEHLDEIGAVDWMLDKAAGDLGLAVAALRDLNESLERRVRVRTEELERANRELEAFSYSISHDLRAPLRSMDGFARILDEDYGALLDAEGRAHLARIRRAAQRMGELIDDVLELARISRSEMKVMEIDLSALAAELCAELASAQPQRRVRAVIAPGVCARGDHTLLRVLLQNLLENAWKYTGGRAEAQVELGELRLPSGEVAYYVRDNGAGFDMAYADRLFRPFSRLHNVEEYPGTGIGLATVARVVGRHGGRVWAEAAVDLGATFFFTLPARSA